MKIHGFLLFSLLMFCFSLQAVASYSPPGIASEKADAGIVEGTAIAVETMVPVYGLESFVADYGFIEPWDEQAYAQFGHTGEFDFGYAVTYLIPLLKLPEGTVATLSKLEYTLLCFRVDNCMFAMTSKNENNAETTLRVRYQLRWIRDAVANTTYPVMGHTADTGYLPLRC